MNMEERFWSKVEKTQDCWNWIGPKNKSGYGSFFLKRINGKVFTDRAHRLSWKMNIGTIPGGLCVLHKCDNPSCVNPDHLFLGTQQDNLLDAREKSRNKWAACYGEYNGRCRLSDTVIREMKQDYTEKQLTPHEIADKYSISFSWAYKILKYNYRASSMQKVGGPE